MHPGEQHIRGEMTHALVDHFSALTLPVENVPYSFDWVEGPGVGLTLTVHSPDGAEVARYKLKVTAEKIGTPKPPAPRCSLCDDYPATTQVDGQPCCTDCREHAEEQRVAPRDEPRPVTTVQLTEPAWMNGTWADVGSGCEVRDDSDKVWLASRNGTEVTITSGADSFTFTPDAAQSVTYRRGSV